MSENKYRKIQPVTEEEYKKCNEWNRMILEEFLQQSHFSNDSIKQYRSAGRIFLRFIHDRFQNKPIHELKARNGMLYQNWLDGLGLSSSAIRLRRSLVSSLSNYIELYYGEDYPLFRNIFPKGVAHIPHSLKNEKEPLTVDEFNHLIVTLDEQGELQMKLYALMAYYTGARRSECIQLKKEIATYEKVPGKNFYATHTVRGKGAGKTGKPFKLYFNDTVMKAMKEYLESRGEDEVEELFVRKFKDGRTEPLSRETFNTWCSDKFSTILGRRTTPHNFRRTRATHMVVEEGMSIDKARSLLNHESSETTSHYVIKDDSDELDDIF